MQSKSPIQQAAQRLLASNDFEMILTDQVNSYTLAFISTAAGASDTREALYHKITALRELLQRTQNNAQ